MNSGKFFLCVGIFGFAIFLVSLRFHPAPKALIADFITPFLSQKKDFEWELDNSSTLKKSKIELLQQIESLNHEILKLKSENQRLHKLKQVNKDLIRLLDIQGREDYDYLAARIITRDPANGGRRVRIDRGTTDNVRVGQAVLAKGFLYGRIHECSKHSSVVLTILDPNCKISVRIANENLHGILFGSERERWKLKPTCIVRYLPRDFEYKEGLGVETSGYSTMIAGSIPVGSLVTAKSGKVTKNIDQLYKIGYVKPLAFTEEFNFVTILIKK